MIQTVAHAVTSCRACNGPLSIPFCDLGEHPLANSYLRPGDAQVEEARFPLAVRVCGDCRLAQLTYVVDERAIFSDYAYLSSTSTSWVAHAASFSRWAIERLGLAEKSLVAEAASNDGYLLKNFVAAGIPCLGIEPAANVAQIAIAAGIPTEIAFLSEATAQDIVAKCGRTADLVIANNVLAHVPDLNDFVAGLAALAGTNGIVSVEAPHLLSLISRVQFDTIYHEHYSYWSLHAMEGAFRRHGLQVFDVHRLSTHGGSLRVFASAQSRKATLQLGALREEEHRAGVEGLMLYESFEERITEVVDAFRDYLGRAKAEGRTIAAYGAAAKGNTFLNRIGLGPDDICMVADANPLKVGTLLPGSHIPVVDLPTLLARSPDDILILPWNLRVEITQLLRKSGFAGRMVTAIPSLSFE